MPRMISGARKNRLTRYGVISLCDVAASERSIAVPRSQILSTLRFSLTCSDQSVSSRCLIDVCYYWLLLYHLASPPPLSLLFFSRILGERLISTTGSKGVVD